MMITEFRFLFWACLGVIVPFGLLLVFIPGSTRVYWAWSIAEPQSAILIGSAYLGGFIYCVQALMQNDWKQTRNGIGGLMVFCGILLIATMMHWDEFVPYHPATLLWLCCCFAGPIMVPILYRKQELVLKSARDGDGLPDGWNLWMIVRGFLYASLAVLWLFNASSVSTFWPWSIGALDLQVFTGQPGVIGWLGLVGLQGERTWRAQRLGLLLGGAIGVTQCVALAIHHSTYGWNSILGILLPLMFVEWVATPVIGYIKFEKPPSS